MPKHNFYVALNTTHVTLPMDDATMHQVIADAVVMALGPRLRDEDLTVEIGRVVGPVGVAASPNLVPTDPSSN